VSVLASFPEGLRYILRIKTGRKRKRFRSAPRLNVKFICVSEVSGDVEESEFGGVPCAETLRVKEV